MSLFLNYGIIRLAPPSEQVPALRQMIAESRAARVAREPTAEDASRRARLTRFLTDGFRVNTRAHEASSRRT